MADIQYDPACMDCRRDNGKDLAGTTWRCAGHVRAERDSLRAKLANVMVEWKHDVEVLTNERNAALLLAEQRGAAYDIEQGLRQKAEREQAQAEERARLKYPQWHRVWESEYLARRMAEDEVEKANRYGNEYLNRLIVAESTRDLHWREVESLRERLDKEQEERGRQYGLRLQIADEFAFLWELLGAVVKTGTKDPLLDARIAEELRSHE